MSRQLFRRAALWCAAASSSVFLAMAPGIGQEELRPPGALTGTWSVAEGCTSSRIGRLEFGARGAELLLRARRVACVFSGWRSLTDRRWYLDLDCAEDGRIDLDINLLIDDRLLVARRPLGEACLYARGMR